MIDLVTWLRLQQTSFNAIKPWFRQEIRDIEGITGDLSRWMGAVSDIKKMKSTTENHHCLKTFCELVRWKRKRCNTHTEEEKVRRYERGTQTNNIFY